MIRILKSRKASQEATTQKKKKKCKNELTTDAIL